MRNALFMLVALLMMPVATASAQRPGFVVIVNEANSVPSLEAAQLAKLFLKRQNSWPTGEKALPVDQLRASQTRESFTTAVHKKSVELIAAFWQQEIFSGRGIPPVEKRSDSDVIAYVRGNRGAVGYVSSSATLGAGVRVIDVRGL